MLEVEDACYFPISNQALLVLRGYFCFTFERIARLQACETHEPNGTLCEMIARVSPSLKILSRRLLPVV